MPKGVYDHHKIRGIKRPEHSELMKNKKCSKCGCFMGKNIHNCEKNQQKRNNAGNRHLKNLLRCSKCGGLVSLKNPQTHVCIDYHNPEYLRKLREVNLGNKNPNWKGGISYGYQKRIGKKFKKYGSWNKYKRGTLTTEIRSDSQFIKKLLKGLQKRPTKPEQQLIDIIKQNNLPFVYTGDGKIIIERLCPDFIDNNGQKKIIEVFGRYWHTGNRNHISEMQRRKIYSKYGFDMLVIWDDELKNTTEKQIVHKIENFRGE